LSRVRHFVEESTIVKIKYELAKRGYGSPEFFDIENKNDTGDNCSSREILLAICWYLSKQKLVHQFITNANTPFDLEMPNELANEVCIFEVRFYLTLPDPTLSYLEQNTC
jgi:hypothetical protein